MGKLQVTISEQWKATKSAVILAHKNATTENPFQAYKDIAALASSHGIETSIETNEHLSKAANDLQIRSAIFSTQKIVEKIEVYAQRVPRSVLCWPLQPAG